MCGPHPFQQRGEFSSILYLREWALEGTGRASVGAMSQGSVPEQEMQLHAGCPLPV